MESHWFSLIIVLIILTAGNCTNDALDSGYYEEDIIPDIAGRTTFVDGQKIWPNKTVYFKIDRKFDREHQDFIRRAMKVIEENSCIKFLRANSNKKNFLQIVSVANGCSSTIGYKKGIRYLYLENKPIGTHCFKIGHILHELFHALGFMHQQKAYNRDEYVKVVNETIKKKQAKNFQKKATTKLLGDQYDYGSVMHAGLRHHTINGSWTVIPLRDDAIPILGQRFGLTKLDIAKLNYLYKCERT